MAGSPPACKELVGVTGSVVKTGTKSMIALALQSSKKPVYQSHGNWNNRIGVALSLMEMEMSGRGELLELARMAEPNIRGGSHFDNFFSLEQFVMAKGERFRRRQSPEMRVFLNADDLPLPFGVQKGGIFVSGLHLALNACAAAAVATRLGVSLSQVGFFLSAFSPLKMRSELKFARNDVKIVNDAYNSNSVSTRAAIDS
ncbi:hypothetical protein ACLB2K_036078 [Fragaria x ananassa]